MRVTRQNQVPRARGKIRIGVALGLFLWVVGLLAGGTGWMSASAGLAPGVRPGDGSQVTPFPTPAPTVTPLRPPPGCELPPTPGPPARTVLQATARAKSPDPRPTGRLAGPYAHRDGQYQLQRTGAIVTASLITAHAPLPSSPVLFTVPAAYRPPFLLWRDVVGRIVQADGTPHPDYPDPYPFRLWIHPDGTIQQGLQTSPAAERYLAYDLTVSWGTSPAANDQAVLELLDQAWFGLAVTSRQPPPRRQEIPVPSESQTSQKTFTVFPRLTRNAEGRVTLLALERLHRPLPIPSELGQLHQLEHLDLSGSSIDYGMRKYRLAQNEPLPRGLTGVIPPELGLLTQLRTLELHDHQLTGPIPPELGLLTRLQKLDLSHNLLTGTVPPELGGLTHLHQLHLQDNWFTALAPELGQLDCLQELWLSLNWLTSLPPALGRLPNLTELILDFNLLTTLPPEVGQLARLRNLRLRGNQLRSLPPEVGELTNLMGLNLTSNQLTTLPPELGQLPNLAVLRVPYNQLTALPPELGQLTNLRLLDLGRNRLTSIPPSLGQLSQLEEVYIYDNPLTGCLPAAWLARWPDLAVTSLDTDGQVIRRRLPACPA